MIDMDKKMNTKLVNISRGTQKNKETINKDNFIYYNTSRNKENIIIFPNIDNYSKFNDINNDNKLRNTHINNREKELKYSKYNEILKKNYNSVDKIKKQYTITEFDTPKIEEKYLGLDKNYLSTSFRNKNYTYNTINSLNHDFFIEEIKNNKLSSSFLKVNKFNFINNNNISNINNIFNKNDYLKNTYSNIKNNIKRKDIMTIKNLKNSDTDISSKENNYENNSIINLLYKKSMKENNQRINKTNKTQRRDEFKEFLQEVLKQYKTKNVIKVKKKIDINCLLKSIIIIILN